MWEVNVAGITWLKKKLNKSKRSALYTEILKNSYERLITDERVRSDMEGQKGKKTVIF